MCPSRLDLLIYFLLLFQIIQSFWNVYVPIWPLLRCNWWGTCGKCRGMLIICWCLMMPTDCGDWELAKVFWMVSFTKMQQPVWIIANICHLRRFTSHALMQQDLFCSFQLSPGDRWLWHIGVWRWRAGQCWECCIPVSSFARTFRLQGTLVSDWQSSWEGGAIILWQCFQFKPFVCGKSGKHFEAQTEGIHENKLGSAWLFLELCCRSDWGIEGHRRWFWVCVRCHHVIIKRR